MDILAASWTRLLEPPTLWGIVTFVVAIVAIVTPQWRRAHQTSEISRLIKRMVEKGYTADEIERILRAGLPEHEHGSRRRSGSFVDTSPASSDPGA